MKQFNNLDQLNHYLKNPCKFEYVCYLINRNEEFVLKSNNEDILITSIKEFFLKDNFINVMNIFKKHMDNKEVQADKKTILDCNIFFNNAYKSNET